MKHIFARDIYNKVAAATLTAESPSYSTILDLDKKVREMSFPKSFNPYVSKDAGVEIFHSSSLALRDFYASQNRTVSTSPFKFYKERERVVDEFHSNALPTSKFFRASSSRSSVKSPPQSVRTIIPDRLPKCFGRYQSLLPLYSKKRGCCFPRLVPYVPLIFRSRKLCFSVQIKLIIYYI